MKSLYEILILGVFGFCFLFVQSASAQVLKHKKKNDNYCFLDIECDYCKEPFHARHHQKVQGNLKHITIRSNCAWVFNVKPVEHHFQNQFGVIETIEAIEFSIVDVIGEGSVNDPLPSYPLFTSSANKIRGSGTVEFDVIFDFDCACTKGWRWGNYNLKVSFVAYKYNDCNSNFE